MSAPTKHLGSPPRRWLRALRPLPVAIAVGLLASIAVQSSFVALGVVGVGATIAVVREFWRSIGDRDQHHVRPIPSGDVEYALRPRGEAVVVLSCCVLVGVVTGLARAWSLVALASTVGALLMVAFVVSAAFDRRIRVTATSVLLLRTTWSRRVVEIPLEHARLCLWGAPSSPTLEISTLGGLEVDISSALLSEHEFLELIAVLEQRSGRAASQESP